MWKTLGRPLLAPVAAPIMCDVRFLAFFWVRVRGFRKWPFGPVSASLGRFRSGPFRSSASGRFRPWFGRFLVPSQGGADTCAFVHKVSRLRSSVRASFLSLSSSVRVRLTFRPFVAWLARRCWGTNLRPCPIGGALWFVGSCGSWWPGSVVAGRSDRSAVRLPPRFRGFLVAWAVRVPGWRFRGSALVGQSCATLAFWARFGSLAVLSSGWRFLVGARPFGTPSA